VGGECKEEAQVRWKFLKDATRLTETRDMNNEKEDEALVLEEQVCRKKDLGVERIVSAYRLTNVD